VKRGGQQKGGEGWGAEARWGRERGGSKPDSGKSIWFQICGGNSGKEKRGGDIITETREKKKKKKGKGKRQHAHRRGAIGRGDFGVWGQKAIN